jgi:hypothetical protein
MHLLPLHTRLPAGRQHDTSLSLLSLHTCLLACLLQESEFYEGVKAESMRSLVEASTGASGTSQYVNMLYSLLKLRQACNHPWLVTGVPKSITEALKSGDSSAPGRSSSSSSGANRSYGSSSGSNTASAAEVAAAKKLPAVERQQLLTLVAHPQSPCPVCMDVPEDPVASRCGHVYCRQCVAGQLEGAGEEGGLSG